jgi:hypothetical protein
MSYRGCCHASHNAGVCAVTSESGLNVADSESMDCGQLECVRVRVELEETREEQ